MNARESVAADQNAEKEWRKKFREIRQGRHICLDVLAKGRCSNHFRCNGSIPEADHTTMWEDKNGKRFILTQPYQIHGESLLLLQRECADRGLMFVIHGWSFHYIGSTVAVEIWVKQ